IHGEADGPVPHRILQRLQPSAVLQSELWRCSHICASQREVGGLRTDHVHQREPARDPVRAEIQLLVSQTRPIEERPGLSLIQGCTQCRVWISSQPAVANPQFDIASKQGVPCDRFLHKLMASYEEKRMSRSLRYLFPGLL